jgi:hypothetical protein
VGTYGELSRSAVAGEQDNLSPVGSPIVLQRRGSVYGANVPMITGMPNYSLSEGDYLVGCCAVQGDRPDDRCSMRL